MAFFAKFALVALVAVSSIAPNSATEVHTFVAATASVSGSGGALAAL